MKKTLDDLLKNVREEVDNIFEETMENTKKTKCNSYSLCHTDECGKLNIHCEDCKIMKRIKPTKKTKCEDCKKEDKWMKKYNFSRSTSSSVHSSIPNIELCISCGKRL